MLRPFVLLSKLNSLDRKSLWLYIAKAVAAGTGVGVHFIFAAIGGVSGYGVLSLFLNLNLLLNYVADFGFTLNGPRLVANGTQNETALRQIQAFRIRLGLLSALLYLLVIGIGYPNQQHLLLFGLPMIAFYGFQSDWLNRGLGRPDKAAYRQMMQSVGQLLLVALAMYLGWEMKWAVLAYTSLAAVTYLLSNPYKWQFFLPLPAPSVVKGQLLVLAGMLTYFATYNMIIPLLTRWQNETVAGFYASHYFLGTSLGTLSVITMEVFMAKAKSSLASYALWLSIFTVIALVGIGLSPFYFDFLYGGKGFYWDGRLTLLVMGMVVVHAFRLYWVNSCLFLQQYRPFLNFNVLALGVHVALLGAWLAMEQEYGPHAALSILLVAESLALLMYKLYPKGGRLYVG
jgi:O-antigen/teichoic acid export membrane protein